MQIRTWAQGLGIMTVAKLASLWKISFVIGSCYTFFSFSSCIVPLTGAVLNPLSVIALFTTQIFLRALFGFGFSLKLLALYIPGMVATTYWSCRAPLMAFAISLISMLLFVIHPVGYCAFSYSLLWIIPMVVALISRQTPFTTALTATFLAHAVGSVIWLYACPMTPAAWIALIPIALAERLFFACGSVGCYYIGVGVLSLVRLIPFKTRVLRA